MVSVKKGFFLLILSAFSFGNLFSNNGNDNSKSNSKSDVPKSIQSVSITLLNNVSCFGGTNGALQANTVGGVSPYTFSWSNGRTTSSITGLAAGNYCVTATDAIGATFTDCFAVTQPTALNASSIINSSFNGFSVSCFGSSNGSATASVSGGTPPYSFVWDIVSQTTQTATGLGAGTYCAYILDANGCRDTTCVSLTQPTAISVATTSTAVACFGQSTGTATANPSGGTGAPFTFLWANGQNSQTATALATGIYGVTVTDLNGCVGTGSAIITQPANPVIAGVNITTQIGCFNGTNGVATAFGNGGVSPYTFLWDGNALGQTTAAASGLSARNYCVTVTDANGCTDDVCITLTQPSLIVPSIASTVNVACRGQATGSATGTATGGSGLYSYLWDNSASNQTTATASGLLAGSYNVTITDQNGCSGVAVATITEPSGSVDVNAVITSNFNGQSLSCFGSSNGQASAAAIDGTAPYSFLWSNGTTGNVANNLSAGTYIVTATDANGCRDTASVTFVNPTAVVPTTNLLANVLCFGGNNGSAFATSTGGIPPYSYVWTNGQTTTTATGLLAGNQCVSVTDANGCLVSSCISITQPNTAVTALANITSAPSCIGSTNGIANVVASGGVLPYSYAWSASAGSQLTSIATGLSSGTHTVTVTDANGCTISASVTLPLIPIVNISIPSVTNVICFGASTGAAVVLASGGNGSPYNYQWSNGQTGSVLSNVSSGSYSVTATDLNGCSVSTSLVITQPTAGLLLNISTSPVSCFNGTNGSATATVSGGQAPYTYSWSVGAVSTPTLNNIPEGSYCVSITDALGCRISSCVTLSEPSGVTATISNIVSATCNGLANGSATVSGNGGTGGYSYLWANGQTNATAVGLSAALSPLAVTVTDANGCIGVTSANIPQPASPVTIAATVNNNVFCNSGNNGTATLSGFGGTGAYSYVWSNGQTTAQASGLIAGVYTATLSDANSCSTSTSVTITEPSALSLTVSTTNVSCNGGVNGSATASVSGGTGPYSYLWDLASGSQTTSTAVGLGAGAYNVTITDFRGCRISGIAPISAPAAVISATINVTSNYNGSQVSCFGIADASANVNVVGGTSPYTYAWSNGGNTATVNGLPAGVTVATVTDANNCRTIATVTISSPSAISVSISTTAVSCNGGNNGTATAVASGGTGTYTYLWNNGSATSTAIGLNAGNACITVSDVNGCLSAACAVVTQPATPVSVVASVVSNYNGAQISCNGNADGIIQAFPSGGTGPYSYSWSQAGNNDSLINLSAGVYNVTVTDANGCQASASATLTEPSIVYASIPSSVNASCFGAANGSATAQGAGGTGAYSFVWSNGQTTATAVGLAAGNYIVSVSDANGCQAVNNISISQPLIGVSASAAVSSNYNGQEVSCNGSCNGSAIAIGSGGTLPYTYQWSANANNQNTATATGLCANTTYRVTITDANGCPGITSITLSQPSAVSVSVISSTSVTCNGGNDGTATALGNGGTGAITYLWSSGATTPLATGLFAGFQFVTATDVNGCTAFSSVIITEPATFLSVAVDNDTLYNGLDISCFGACNAAFSVNASGGTAGYSYLWSTGATSVGLSGMCPGTYTVTISDAGGCIKTDSIEITEPTLLTAAVSAQTNILCRGNNTGSFSVSVSGGTAGYTFNIGSGPFSSTTFNNLVAGSYTVTVEDLNYCATTVSTTITEPATNISAIAALTQQVSCNNACNGAAAVAASGGVAPYTYLWSANGQTSFTATGLCGGTNYAVTVTDANACPFTATVSIPNPALLTGALVSTTNVVCNGNPTGAATISANGGTLPYTFSIGSGNQNNGNFNNLNAGNYVATITDARGCTATVPFVINSNPSLVISSIAVSSNYNGQNISCNGNCDGAATVVASGGSGTYQFLWSNGQTTFTATGLCAAAYDVTVTDQFGCRAFSSISLTAPTALTASIVNQINIGCAGATTGSFQVTAAGGTAPYTFNIGNGPLNNGNFSNLAAGSYCVTVSDRNNCQQVVCTSIAQNSPLTLTTSVLANNFNTCNNAANGSAQVTVAGGTAPYSYQWSNGQNTDIATGLAGGVYCVTVTDVNTCVQSACVTITNIGPGPLDITVNTTTNATCFGVANGTITVSASGGVAPYIYSINGGLSFSNQVTFNNLAGTVLGANYNIIVRDNLGCQDTVTAVVFEPAQLQGIIINETDVTCFGGNNGSVYVGASGGTAPYVYSFQGGAFTTTDSFVGLTAGNYAIAVRDANGCQANIPVIINQPAVIVLNLVAQVNPSCNQACDGQIQISATGGTSPYSYSNDGAVFQNNGVFNNLCAGVYPMTIRDAQSCLRTVNVTLNDPAPLSVTVSMTQAVSCNAGSNGRAVAVAFGGTNPYTYQWSPSGQLTAIATGLTAGSQSVIVTDANGCTVQGSVSITQPNALAATINSVINPTCFGSTNGSIVVQADPTSGVGPYSYNIGTGVQAGGTFINLAAGNYTITLTDNNSCSILIPVTLVEPAAVDAPNAVVLSNYNGNSISCFGACDGIVEVPNPITGGTAPYNFLWSNNASTQIVSGLCAGLYRVTITDSNGCTDTTSVSVSQPLALNANAVAINTSCSGSAIGNITVTATGGTAPYVYSLNGGASQSSNVFTNLTAGTYNIVVTDVNNCSFTVSSAITSAAPVIVNAVATSNYAGFNISCFGSTDGAAQAAAAGGIAPYTYLWSGGQNTNIATGLSGGVNTVTATDANGCTGTTTITLTEPSEITVTVTNSVNPLCGSAATGIISVSASGGAGAYTFSINGGAFQGNNTFNNLTATTHNITARDANGCTVTISETLTAPTTLQVNVSVTNVTCFGFDDGTASANVTGGTPFANGGYTYIWSPGGQTNQSIGNLPGNVNYTVTVQDASGCIAFGSAFVSRPTQLVAVLTNITPVDCNGNNNGSFEIRIVGASGSYLYSVDGGQNFINVTTNPVSVTGLAGGTYLVVVRDSVSSSCEVPLNVEILENGGLLTTVATTSVSCFGQVDGTATAVPSGGSGSYTYLWDNGQTAQTATGLSANFIDSVFTAAPYVVTVTDANGCSVVYNIVGVGSPDELIATDSVISNILCFGENTGSARVNVSGGNPNYAYLWSTLSTTQEISGLVAGNYVVTVTDTRGCTDIANVSVTQPSSALNMLIEIDSVSCFGLEDGRLRITNTSGGTGPYEFSFDENGPFGPDSLISVNQAAGEYAVTVRDTNGCLLTVDSLVIFEPADIVVSAFQDQTIRIGEPALVTAEVNINNVDSSLVSWYYYTDNGTNVVCQGADCFSASINQIYDNTLLIFALNNGCGDSASVSITVNDKESAFVPNVFTPNGDGNNDIFAVYGSTDVKEVKLFRVFNRWGELVFESENFRPNDLSNGWDGTFKGERLNTAVFVYYTEIELQNGEIITRKGDVTLFR